MDGDKLRAAAGGEEEEHDDLVDDDDESKGTTGFGRECGDGLPGPEQVVSGPAQLSGRETGDEQDEVQEDDCNRREGRR